MIQLEVRRWVVTLTMFPANGKQYHSSSKISMGMLLLTKTFFFQSTKANSCCLGRYMTSSLLLGLEASLKESLFYLIDAN
jgi:hypothetical protein